MASQKSPRVGMFGKPLSEYLSFQKIPLAIVAAAGLARLGLSLAGLSNETVAFLSMTVLGWLAVLYYGVAAHTSGFGSYKELLPLVTIQVVLVQLIAVLGILLSTAGLSNVYAAPEYSGPLSGPSPNQWIHALAHLTIGIVVPILLSWAVASLVMLAAKKLSRGRVAAT